MITLTYGYKLPETNDKGPIVFPALEDNIQQLNDHNHNGANSSKLTAQSIEGVPEAILAAGWVVQPNNQYRQLVTVPAGFDYDTITISFRLSNGDCVWPTVEKVSDTQYYLYTNDNTADYIAVYGG